ncbi:MAG: serine hydrolase domain-containing protein [Sandaracinaceae bacterium]
MHRCTPLLALSLLCGCADAPGQFPTEEWRHVAPEEAGVDSRVLAAALEDALDGGLHLHELLVVRHGAIVLDARFFPYDGTRPHDVGSCTKTLTSLAVGAALESGAIASLDAPVLSFFPERSFAHDDARKRALTLEDLLTMRSGLDCVAEPAEPTLSAMIASPDPIQFTLDLPMVADPGAAWSYCGPASHVASAVVGATTGMPEDEWLRARLFDRIGVGEVVWPRDAQGVAHGWGDARVDAEDLARVGLLLLHGGEWDGERLLDPAWVSAATTNRVGSAGPASGYGYQIWIESGGGFYANGRGGQFVFVQPDEDLVIVALGSASPDELPRWFEVLGAIRAGLHDAPLPASPEGEASLSALVTRAAAPPAPMPVDPLPAIGAEISGVEHTVASSPIGWERFALRFADDHASLTVTVGAAASTFDVGLDGVPRITRGGRLGSDPRHDDLDLAATGRWTREDTFEIVFDTIDRIDAGTLTFTFDADGAAIDLFERTYLLTHLPFEARR